MSINISVDILGLNEVSTTIDGVMLDSMMSDANDRADADVAIYIRGWYRDKGRTILLPRCFALP